MNKIKLLIGSILLFILMGCVGTPVVEKTIWLEKPIPNNNNEIVFGPVKTENKVTVDSAIGRKDTLDLEYLYDIIELPDGIDSDKILGLYENKVYFFTDIDVSKSYNSFSCDYYKVSIYALDLIEKEVKSVTENIQLLSCYQKKEWPKKDDNIILNDGYLYIENVVFDDTNNKKTLIYDIRKEAFYSVPLRISSKPKNYDFGYKVDISPNGRFIATEFGPSRI